MPLNEKSQTPSGELGTEDLSLSILRMRSTRSAFPFKLGWVQYVFLITIDNPEERRFLEIEASTGGWTLPELKRQFNSGLYERLALSRDKGGVRKLTAEGQLTTRSEDLLKELYAMAFFGLDEKEKCSESDIESAIIDNLEHFLLELGKGFLCEARQKCFTFDEEHFFVDLVFLDDEKFQTPFWEIDKEGALKLYFLPALFSDRSRRPPAIFNSFFQCLFYK